VDGSWLALHGGGFLTFCRAQGVFSLMGLLVLGPLISTLFLFSPLSSSHKTKGSDDHGEEWRCRLLLR
jgi:hypothetical protein